MNLRDPFLRARFWASSIVGLAYVLAFLYVGGRYPFLVGISDGRGYGSFKLRQPGCGFWDAWKSGLPNPRPLPTR
jgi:hypothetical protein